MAHRAKIYHSTPGWRSCLFEGAAFVFILVATGTASYLIASSLNHTAQCFQPKTVLR
jgi:hypothetical protein